MRERAKKETIVENWIEDAFIYGILRGIDIRENFLNVSGISNAIRLLIEIVENKRTFLNHSKVRIYVS